MQDLEEIKKHLTEEELALALELGIVQLIYIKTSEIEDSLISRVRDE